MPTPQINKRKLRAKLMLPILALPMGALLFFALGGGTGNQPNATAQHKLNSLLPSPQLEEKSILDKLSSYIQADEDSARKAQEQLQDPFSSLSNGQSPLAPTLPEGAVEEPFSDHQTPNLSPLTNPARSYRSPDQQVNELSHKLASLQTLVDEKAENTRGSTLPGRLPETHNTESSSEINQLNELMRSVADGSSQADPELNKMSGMLDKILDIQHPDRVNERLKNNMGQKGQLIPVMITPAKTHQEYFGKKNAYHTDTTAGIKPKPVNRQTFYGAAEAPADTVNDRMAISAVIHENQTIVTGATIKIRLLQPVYVEGKFVPKGTFLFGTCALSGERLLVDISSLRYEQLLFPVKLSAFDLDGNAGIRIPGSISRDASKQATDQAIQSVALNSLDPSIGAQAAAAGIETAKNLISKKVKLVRVTIKGDYPVLLKQTQDL